MRQIRIIFSLISRPHMDALIAALPYNQNNVAKESSPLTTELEARFVRFLSEDDGYDTSNSWGYVSVGGPSSNLEGLWISRNKARESGKKAKYVLASDDCHYSLRKSCDILGLEPRPLRVDPTLSARKIAVVVCTIGTTETGQVDNLEFWVGFCSEHKIHLHVDAAYGGYFMHSKESALLSPAAKSAFASIHLADSITIDPHKSGYAPYPIGCFLLKNIEDIRHVTMTKDVAYIKPTTSECTVEGSRSGALIASAEFGHRTLRRHYPLLLNGIREGADALKKEIPKSRNFDLFQPPDLGMVLFRSKNSTPPGSYLAECFTN
jgi:tyrosine decarboxylase/aspartate 1-decarboxylase